MNLKRLGRRTRMSITGGINGTLMRGNDEEIQSRTDVSRRCCCPALKETCRQLQEEKREEKVKGVEEEEEEGEFLMRRASASVTAKRM